MHNDGPQSIVFWADGGEPFRMLESKIDGQWKQGRVVPSCGLSAQEQLLPVNRTVVFQTGIFTTDTSRITVQYQTAGFLYKMSKLLPDAWESFAGQENRIHRVSTDEFCVAK